MEYAEKWPGGGGKGGGRNTAGGAPATALTAEPIGRAVGRWGLGAADSGAEIVISGGGAKNPALVERLAAKGQPRPVVLFERLFFDGEAKEAVAFSFLGTETVMGKAGHLPAATGGRRPGGL